MPHFVSIMYSKLISLTGILFVCDSLAEITPAIDDILSKSAGSQCVESCTKTFCIEAEAGYGFLSQSPGYEISTELRPSGISGNTCEIRKNFVQINQPPLHALKEVCAVLNVKSVGTNGIVRCTIKAYMLKINF